MANVPDAPRRIFRETALRRYANEKERAVVPRFVRPRTFAALWVLVALCLVTVLIAFRTRIPVYASGQATVADGGGLESPAIVAFLPPDALKYLRVGQKVFIRLDSGAAPVTASILTLDPELRSPGYIYSHYGLPAALTAHLSGPAAVVIAKADRLVPGLKLSEYQGGLYRADVQTGSRRVVSVVPIIGNHFGD